MLLSLLKATSFPRAHAYLYLIYKFYTWRCPANTFPVWFVRQLSERKHNDDASFAGSERITTHERFHTCTLWLISFNTTRRPMILPAWLHKPWLFIRYCLSPRLSLFPRKLCWQCWLVIVVPLGSARSLVENWCAECGIYGVKRWGTFVRV